MIVSPKCIAHVLKGSKAQTCRYAEYEAMYLAKIFLPFQEPSHGEYLSEFLSSPNDDRYGKWDSKYNGHCGHRKVKGQRDRYTKSRPADKSAPECPS